MTVRIDADTLIPGRGEPIGGGTVVMEGPTIVYAGPKEAAPETPGAEVVTVPVVMPGMWECHGHFIGSRTAFFFEELVQTPTALAAIRAARDAEAVLAGGFTSVREVGGLGVYLQRAIEEGFLVGPTIYGAHNILSQTGGHADMHSLPSDWVRNYERLVICDGVPECLRAVRLQLRVNAKVIKICASGGVMSEIDHPIHQQFSAEELAAIVEEAGRAERAVAAHCHGKPGIMAALEAGVKTIEHGTYLDEEAAQAMVETGAVLVPTRFIIEQLLGMKDDLPTYGYEKAVMVADRHLEAMQIAIAAGVEIALGTDVFMSGPLWGTNGLELKYFVEAGMTPLQAIEAATANGPSTLGPQAPAAGVLREGFDADVITLDRNPLDNILVLADPSNVTGVWKAGARVKG